MDFPKTKRTTLKRLPKRGVYDRNSVYAILDEGFICHVGFVVDGRPVVIPTGYARVEDRLFIHGSQASRMLRTLSQGIDVCVTVTLIDGLVLARSAFHHSINYRSVVVFGKASLVEDTDDKGAALFAFSEHVIPVNNEVGILENFPRTLESDRQHHLPRGTQSCSEPCDYPKEGDTV